MLRELKAKYLEGSLTKQDYCSQVYRAFTPLHDIADFLSETDVKSCELTNDGVILRFKSLPISLFFDTNILDASVMSAIAFSTAVAEKDYGYKLIESLKTAHIFFDIGAFVGYYSLTCGKYNPDAKICAFEPVPSTYRELARNVALNDCHNISAYNFGFFEKEAVLPMYINKNEGGANSLRNIRGTAEEQQNVSFQTLDAFVEWSGLIPDVMKIDVEGAELFVLRGGEKTLRKGHPVIFIEILRKWCRAFGHEARIVFDLLHDLDYQSYVVRGKDFKVIDNITEETEDTNFVFIKR